MKNGPCNTAKTHQIEAKSLIKSKLQKISNTQLSLIFSNLKIVDKQEYATDKKNVKLINRAFNTNKSLLSLDFDFKAINMLALRK